ncbi:replication initiator [Spongiactinospora rosea]|uniref:replication initiator n=1 Tax=Spongiactinospora rosea TaxID=2248750 RepID=UPI0018F27C48|nr:replication initiator [Spongiactinospora rosea]
MLITAETEGAHVTGGRGLDMRSVPLEVAEKLAQEAGVCIRPLAFRVHDAKAGTSRVVEVACGARLEAKCPPCAKRNRQARMAQCREGWHLEAEPEPALLNEGQQWLVEFRADLRARRDAMEAAGEDVSDWAAAIAGVEEEMRAAGIPASVIGRTSGPSDRRVRSTRRRQDAPNLPRRVMAATTVGRTYAAPDGKVYRPSLFVTLTLPSYGRVRDGVPVDPETYDYSAAARGALHFSKLVDRFVQNLRRVAGFEVQYFASVEYQKRLAPHLHLAIRGTIPRAEIRRVVAATYHQVWWPSTDVPAYEGETLPEWVDGVGYVDSAGAVLPTWDEALDSLGADDAATPLHVVSFGKQMDIQGVLAGSPDADQRVRHLAKYLTKSLDASTGKGGADNAARRRHAARLVESLRFEPCSPRCANWLRYGVQPKDAKPDMVPGRCRGKAHSPTHLGYGGRRVLVSRKWSGRTLGEHRRERRAWVMEALGITADEATATAGRYSWEQISGAELGPLRVRLLRLVAERRRSHVAMQSAEAGGDVGCRGPGPSESDQASQSGDAALSGRR